MLKLCNPLSHLPCSRFTLPSEQQVRLEGCHRICFFYFLAKSPQPVTHSLEGHLFVDVQPKGERPKFRLNFLSKYPRVQIALNRQLVNRDIFYFIPTTTHVDHVWPHLLPRMKQITLALVHIYLVTALFTPLKPIEDSLCLLLSIAIVQLLLTLLVTHTTFAQLYFRRAI